MSIICNWNWQAPIIFTSGDPSYAFTAVSVSLHFVVHLTWGLNPSYCSVYLPRVEVGYTEIPPEAQQIAHAGYHCWGKRAEHYYEIQPTSGNATIIHKKLTNRYCSSKIESLTNKTCQWCHKHLYAYIFIQVNNIFCKVSKPNEKPPRLQDTLQKEKKKKKNSRILVLNR